MPTPVHHHPRASEQAQKILGVTNESIEKEKGLAKLGICDDSLKQEQDAKLRSGHVAPKSFDHCNKKEYLMGYTEEQLNRERAMKKMGITEHDIEEDYSQRVARIGKT